MDRTGRQGSPGWVVAVGVEWAEWSESSELSEPADAYHRLWPGYWIQGVAGRLSADRGDAEEAGGERITERREPPS